MLYSNVEVVLVWLTISRQTNGFGGCNGDQQETLMSIDLPNSAPAEN
jgi:hypothetical protein